MVVVRRKRDRRPILHPQTNIPAIQSGAEARALYDKAGLKNSLSDLEKFISSLGIRLARKPLRDDYSGFLHEENGSWVMGVNSLHHPNRQRFTLAHELGHYFLHRESKQEFDDNYVFTRAEELSNPMEWEANQFAAEFLMPTEDFRDAIQSGTTQVSELAKFFSVSTMAVRIRAKNLGIGGHGLE